MEAVLKTVGLIAPGVRIPHHPMYTEPTTSYVGDLLNGEMPERPKGTVC